MAEPKPNEFAVWLRGLSPGQKVVVFFGAFLLAIELAFLAIPVNTTRLTTTTVQSPVLALEASPVEPS